MAEGTQTAAAAAAQFACGEAVAAAAASGKEVVGLVATMPVVSDSLIGSAVVVVVA